MHDVKGKLRKILIVEDDKDMQEIYRDIFRDESNYEIELESDPLDGLKKTKQKAYDLIILDIIMDPIPGDSFFVYLRDEDKIKHIPILVVSILGEDSLELLKRLGQTDFLKKPIKKEELMKKINKILS